MVDVPEAHRILFENVRPGPTTTMSLRDALFRTLAQPVRCDIDYPPFDRSVMDGYAVRSADVSQSRVRLSVVGRIAAGHVPDKPLLPGQAIQINTGAPLPAGADAVVRAEDASLSASGDEVEICQPAPSGQFVTPRGRFVRDGQTVLPAGTRLTSLEIGVAAAAGAVLLTVYRPPTVAILSTGDELIDIGAVPVGPEIRNSNQHMLEALIRSAHAVPAVLDGVADDPTALRDRLRTGQSYDVLCVTGGVSVGAFDFVPQVLAELGGTFHIQKMMIKPGRPTVFASMPAGTLVFGLPGNPVSAFVGFELLVRPALAALEGRPGVVPQVISARLIGTAKATENRRSFWPARAAVDDSGHWAAEALAWQGSGDLFGMAAANALIVRPPESRAAGPNEAVSILLLDRV